MAGGSHQADAKMRACRQHGQYIGDEDGGILELLTHQSKQVTAALQHLGGEASAPDMENHVQHQIASGDALQGDHPIPGIGMAAQDRRAIGPAAHS